MDRFDVIVIGGGHAGAEAAALSARSGADTLLLTQHLETIGQMSCNPAIGGIAKGTVVREVDALGGIMGRATDLARVQFRMLNRSKGPAVWSPRAQCDRGLYRRSVRLLLERLPRIRFVQGTVASLLMKGHSIEGVLTSDGRRYLARAVVVTAGTFLRGRIHMGLDTPVPAGRAGESPAVEIAQHLELLGLTVERFKTGTPPRIDGRSVDLTRLERQDGESEPYWFSHFDRPDHPQQLPCYLTNTGPELNAIIRDHLELSALYGGAISGRGPRYCPSIEDKVVRFPDAESHQVFLEPEGLETNEMYVNGLSTSLPPDVQVAYLRSVPGLDRVEMTRPGYAIEYDYFPPTQLNATLGVKGFDGLFFAGQINGTTGYEEAAGQGVVAGINAAAFALGKDSVTIGRDAAFIGVLIDDLVTRGVDEPYRLFTSRAEFRLLLRQDNALRRLLPLVDSLGTLTDAERRVGEGSLMEEDTILELAKERMVFPAQVNELLGSAGTPPVTQAVRVADLVRRPGVMLHEVLLAAGEAVDRRHAHWGEVEIKYEGYVTRERELASKTASMEFFELPVDFDYPSAVTIAFEAREKLSLVRPSTLGQAGRVPGVTPSDLQNLIVEVLRRRRAVPLP